MAASTASRTQGDERDQGKRAGSHGAGQAVDAVDHVEGVDAADHAEHGEGHGDDAERQRADEQGVAEVDEHDAAAVDHEQGQPGLDDEADAGAELPAVVREAHAPHDQRAHCKRGPGQGLRGQQPQQHAHGQQQRGEHAEATHEGGAVHMLLVFARVVDETDMGSEAQHAADDGGRQHCT